ncbi:MAG: ribosome-recycling factor [Candidatus Pacebacteria bacterium]|nr:ribosome-recycling factor [Candidatus Paceibacterota bacterium]
MDTKKIFNETEEEFKKTTSWFKNEISGLRGSRISIELFDTLRVNCYENTMSLKEVATLSLIDPKTVAIEPWDKSLNPAIEKCLTNSGLEGNIKNEGKRILFSVPIASQEEKEKIIKLLKQKLEQAKESLRHTRDDTWSKIQELERNGEISEDDKFKGKDELQNLINNAEKEVEKIEDLKEKEIIQ